MATTYKLGTGLYKITPEASIYLANQMFYFKSQYGLTPGTVIIDTNRFVIKKLGATMATLDLAITPLVASNGILYYMGNPEPPVCNQARIWAIEMSNA